MESSAIATHLQRTFRDGKYTDAVVALASRTPAGTVTQTQVWRVHKAILSLSGYFQALMSDAWAPGAAAASAAFADAALCPRGSTSSAAYTRADSDTSSHGDSRESASRAVSDTEEGGTVRKRARQELSPLDAAAASPPSCSCVVTRGSPRAATQEFTFLLNDDSDSNGLVLAGSPEGTWLTARVMDAVIKYLYGFEPELSLDMIQPLLLAATFFSIQDLCDDVRDADWRQRRRPVPAGPSLRVQVADYAFRSMTIQSVTMLANMVHTHEFGDAGKLIEDACFAFLYRNAIDVGAGLSDLPLGHQKRVLMAPEMYTQTEFQRYKLALQTKRCFRAKLLAARRRARSAADASLEHVSSDELLAACHAPGADALGLRVDRDGRIAAPATQTQEQLDGDERAPRCYTPPAWMMSVSSVESDDDGVSGLPGGTRAHEHAEASCASSTRSLHHREIASGDAIAADAHPHACTRTSRCASVSSVRGKDDSTLESLPPSPEASEEVRRTSPVDDEDRHIDEELARVEAVYKEIFAAIRYVHFTPEQLTEARMDGEVPLQLLQDGAALHSRMLEKLEVANRYNVKRLTELATVDTGDAQAVCGVAWSGFRFGVEVRDVFSEANAPSAERESVTVVSERAFFGGSLWSLDLKRYLHREEKTEYVAVYLRRRSLRNTTFAGNGTFEDLRDRTTVAFSIRLCGAPGAPTTNSVCGKSTSGKSFGCDTETSWGWETYISSSHITEKPWAEGDILRFVVQIDLL